MQKQEVTSVVEKLAAPLAAALGLELVDVEYIKERGQMVLRILIDHEKGVSFEDCEALSRSLGDELDKADPLPHSYSLEVSSAGLERPLKKETDFTRFTGRKVKIKLFGPFNGRKNFNGTLFGFEGGQILLQDEDAGVLRIPLNQVAKANLVYEPKSV